MQIRLPSAADVANAVEIWRSDDVRLAVLLNRYDESAPALRHYGLVLWEAGQLQSAAQALCGAAALKPDDIRVWSDLTGVFNALGQQNEAAACAEECLSRDGTQPRMWMQLGSIRNALGDRDASRIAFERAIELDASLVDAWVGLGLTYFGAKLFRQAVGPLEEAVKRGKDDDAAVQACLGEARYSVGDFAGAARAFSIALRLQPGNQAFSLKRARAQFAVDVINGSAQDALDSCEQFALSPREIEQTLHEGFHLLSAYGHRDAAIRLGQLRLARAPDDRMQAYLLATLQGEPMHRAPDDYIVTFFDRFAENFDEQLVEVLGYKPGDLVDLARRSDRPIRRVLDLGCGTGLAGSLLAAPGRMLTGVDLSPRMLDKAKALGCYTALAEAEVVAFLSVATETYDLVIAADVLIYFGDLDGLFEGVARVLDKGGLWACSIETSDETDIAHLSSGRFAHRLDYVEAVAAKTGFLVLELQHARLRLDAGHPAMGVLLLLAKY